MKWIILLSLVVFSLSCSNHHNDELYSKASMKCLLSGESLSHNKVDYYKRGDAPVCTKSITITSQNQEYSVPNVVTTFTFNPAGEQDTDLDIIMKDLTVGSNKITAVSTCQNGPLNAIYTDITRPNVDDIDDRTDQYAADLLVKQPVHAIYTEKNPVIKVISTDDSKNGVTINMGTVHHRVAAVVENDTDSEYLLKVSIEKGQGEVLLSTTEFIQIGSQVAFVINDSDAVGAIDYTVRIKHFTKTSQDEIADKEITDVIEAVSYNNRTRLYHFTKSTFEKGNATSTITWDILDAINDNKTYE